MKISIDLTEKQKREVVEEWVNAREQEIRQELADLNRVKRMFDEKIQYLQSPFLFEIFIDGAGI